MWGYSRFIVVQVQKGFHSQQAVTASYVSVLAWSSGSPIRPLCPSLLRDRCIDLLIKRKNGPGSLFPFSSRHWGPLRRGVWLASLFSLPQCTCWKTATQAICIFNSGWKIIDYKALEASLRGLWKGLTFVPHNAGRDTLGLPTTEILIEFTHKGTIEDMKK